MLNKTDILSTNLPKADERDANYRATNPAQQAPIVPAGAQPSFGWMQGVLAAKDLQLQQNQDARSKGMLDIAHHEDTRSERTSMQQAEGFDWKRQDRAKMQFIEQGMATSFQQGGYEGVIDFLGANDPERALDFTKKKLELDASIMSNSVMQSLVPSKQAEAMVEGYNVIGKMGQSLLNAPEEDRNVMYQQMLPILKTINPNAPDGLDSSAVSMFMLAAGQAMPASQLFGASRAQLTSESAMGKLDVDIRSRLAAGETLENSPLLRAMVSEYKQHETNAEYSKEKLESLQFKKMMGDAGTAKDQAQANAAKYQITANMNSRLLSESKRFIELQDQKNTFDGAMDAIASGGGGAAQTAAYRNVAMMFNKGALSEPDVAAFANSDNTIAVARKKLESVYSGKGIQALNPTEIQRLRILVEKVYDRAAGKQQMINDRYRGMAQKFGVDEKDLSLYDPAAPDTWMQADVPPDIAQQAKAAVAAGASKSAVNQRIKELLKGNH